MGLGVPRRSDIILMRQHNHPACPRPTDSRDQSSRRSQRQGIGRQIGGRCRHAYEGTYLWSLRTLPREKHMCTKTGQRMMQSLYPSSPVQPKVFVVWISNFCARAYSGHRRPHHLRWTVVMGNHGKSESELFYRSRTSGVLKLWSSRLLGFWLTRLT